MLHRYEDIDSLFKVCAKYNFHDPEWFGGVYFDDDGEIHISIVDGPRWQSRCDEMMRELDGEGDIHFEKVRYSLRWLSESSGKISGDPGSVRRGIRGTGVDIKNNRITLAVTEDFCDDGLLPDRDVFNIELFEWLKNDIGEKNDDIIAPADILSNGKCFFTAAYPARNKENLHGVVTAGHIPEIKEDMRIFADGEDIGSIHGFEFSDEMDAAFIALDNGNKCSDRTSVPPNPAVRCLAPEFICGAGVEMYSGNNGHAMAGKAVYPTFDFMNLKNIAVFTYSSSGGDSGSPILIPFGSDDHRLAGIHLGSFSMSGKVYAYGRLAKDINKRLSLEIDA